jgi:hypothetical protein
MGRGDVFWKACLKFFIVIQTLETQNWVTDMRRELRFYHFNRFLLWSIWCVLTKETPVSRIWKIVLYTYISILNAIYYRVTPFRQYKAITRRSRSCWNCCTVCQSSVYNRVWTRVSYLKLINHLMLFSLRSSFIHLKDTCFEVFLLVRFVRAVFPLRRGCYACAVRTESDRLLLCVVMYAPLASRLSTLLDHKGTAGAL